MTTTQTIIVLLPILLISLSVHETMHALASFWLGDDTAAEGGRVSLNPIRHIDPYLTVLLPLFSVILLGNIIAIAKPVIINPNKLKYDEFGSAIVAVVGPLSNLALAGCAGLIFYFLDPMQGTLTYNILTLAGALNLILFVINLIPWPPLDGSRVLYAFAPEPIREFMTAIEMAGLSVLILFLLIVLPVLFPLVNNLVASLMSALGLPMPMI